MIGAHEIVQSYIDRGEAWHVGLSAQASQYIFTTLADAEAMLAHLHAIPGCSGYAIRTQAEINIYREKARIALAEAQAAEADEAARRFR